MTSPAPKRVKKPLNITVAPDVRNALQKRADAHQTSVSHLLATLAKVYCELPIGASEKPIEADLKRALGRAQFIAFLEAVQAALPKEAEVVSTSRSSAEGSPEAWKIRNCGVLAFYAPEEANVGVLFSKASALKFEHDLSRILVVTTNGSTVPAGVRADLAAASIMVVSLADFPATLAKASAEKKSAGSARALLKRPSEPRSGKDPLPGALAQQPQKQPQSRIIA